MGANRPAQLLNKRRNLFALGLGILLRDRGLLIQILLILIVHILPYAIDRVGEITPLVSLRCTSDLRICVSPHELIRSRCDLGTVVGGRLSLRQLRREEIGGVIVRGKVREVCGQVAGEGITVRRERVIGVEGAILHLLRVLE